MRAKRDTSVRAHLLARLRVHGAATAPELAAQLRQKLPTCAAELYYLWRAGQIERDRIPNPRLGEEITRGGTRIAFTGNKALWRYYHVTNAPENAAGHLTRAAVAARNERFIPGQSRFA